MKLQAMNAERIALTLQAIAREHSPDGHAPKLQYVSTCADGVVMFRWPAVRGRHIAVVLAVGHATEFEFEHERIWRRTPVEPKRRGHNLLSLIHRGWTWVQGRSNEEEHR